MCATRVASLYADVNANTSGFMSGMTAVKGTLSGAAGLFSSFSSVAVGALGAAAIGAIAFQKALEFGDEGAQILQTRDSFDSLASSLGQGPELLNELTAATRGTVTELDLMSSTNTLLMGTSGELGRQLAENAPQLAAIAQAAHDLNPTMGTTAEMYDRLSRGIKKAEPELLDEVGILMNLTQVYKQYADAHGITVTAMDKTMKTEAMLNAVLKQGNTLIEQAGKVSTDASTSIDRMQTSLENAGNAVKEKYAPAVAEAAEFVTYLVSGSNAAIDAFRREQTVVGATAQTYEEYLEAQRGTISATGVYLNSQGMLVNAAGKVVNANYAMSRSEWEVARSLQATSTQVGSLNSVFPTAFNSTQAFATGASNMALALDTSTVSVYDQEAAMTAYGDRLTGLAGYYAELETAEQNRIATAGLLAGVQGTLGDATASYQETLSQLIAQEGQINEALIAASEQGYGPNSQKVQELTEALKQNQEAQVGALESLQNLTNEMIFNQISAGLNTQAALDLARGMGVLSEADYTVATAFETLKASYDLNHDGLWQANEDQKAFVQSSLAMSQAIGRLQEKNLPITLDNIKTELSQMADTTAAETMEDVGDAATPAAEGTQSLADAAANAAPALADTATSGGDSATALKNIGSAAPGATTGISGAGGAARAAITPLAQAAVAAGNLATALGSIRSPGTIRVTVTGVDSAILELQRLSSAINQIDTNITINANVVTNTSSGGGGGGGGGGPHTGPYSDVYTPLTENYTENYYVYNPLAAAMLVQQKKTATVQRLESLMNG